jgi:hypothetical protein
MPARSTAVATEDFSFSIAVQKCEHPNCRKNGTHHLSINSSFSSETGQDCQETVHKWYCDKHFNYLFNSGS